MVHKCVCVKAYIIGLVHEPDKFKTPEEQARLVVENEGGDTWLVDCICIDLSKAALKIIRKALDEKLRESIEDHIDILMDHDL